MRLTIAHGKAVAVTFAMWLAGLVWLWPRAARSQALSADVAGYDWLSLEYASGLGLLGGVLALIYALASDRRALLTVLAESSRNALVSPLGGGAAYLCIKALAGMGWVTVTAEPRFLIIVAAGWAGIGFFEWARSFVKAGAAAYEQRVFRSVPPAAGGCAPSDRQSGEKP